MNEGSKLQCKQTIFGAGAAHDFQESFGTDQDGLGLAVNRQDNTCAGIFKGVENLRKVSVKLTTANEANTRLRIEASIPLGLDSAKNMKQMRRTDRSRLALRWA